MAFHPQGDEFSDWLCLALAEHALGRTDAAKAAAARARSARPSTKTGTARERAEVDSARSTQNTTMRGLPKLMYLQRIAAMTGC
jgi:hypothetical protein